MAGSAAEAIAEAHWLLDSQFVATNKLAKSLASLGYENTSRWLELWAMEIALTLSILDQNLTTT